MLGTSASTTPGISGTSCHTWAPQEVYSSMQEIYYKVLLWSTLGKKGMGTGQREKLGCNVVSAKAYASPLGSSKIGMALQSCPKMGQESCASVPDINQSLAAGCLRREWELEQAALFWQGASQKGLTTEITLSTTFLLVPLPLWCQCPCLERSCFPFNSAT